MGVEEMKAERLVAGEILREHGMERFEVNGLALENLCAEDGQGIGQVGETDE